LAKAEYRARGVALLVGEESNGGDAREFANETRDGVELFFSAPRDRQHDGAGALAAKIVEYIVQRIAVQRAVAAFASSIDSRAFDREQDRGYRLQWKWCEGDGLHGVLQRVEA